MQPQQPAIWLEEQGEYCYSMEEDALNHHRLQMQQLQQEQQAIAAQRQLVLLQHPAQVMTQNLDTQLLVCMHQQNTQQQQMQQTTQWQQQHLHQQIQWQEPCQIQLQNQQQQGMQLQHRLGGHLQVSHPMQQSMLSSPYAQGQFMSPIAAPVHAELVMCMADTMMPLTPYGQDPQTSAYAHHPASQIAWSTSHTEETGHFINCDSQQIRHQNSAVLASADMGGFLHQEMQQLRRGSRAFVFESKQCMFY